MDFALERFFDTVSHSKLIEILSRTIKDGRVVSLIHKYLRCGVMNKDLYEMSEEGTPQEETEIERIHTWMDWILSPCRYETFSS